MKNARFLLLALAATLGLAAGCGSFNWAQVPVGERQYPLDLQVAGLTQRYTVVEPQPSDSASSAAAGAQAPRHPGVVLLHSGFWGDERVSARLARRLAGMGVVVVLPSYRGELRRLDDKRSDGKIEFCHGEVDDAEAALNWLRQRPYVDPQRLAAVGASHGGCIALRLGQRAPELRALVTLSAPVAAAPLLQYLRDHPDDTFFFNGILAGWLAGYINASPQANPEKYEERSPLSGMERVRSAMLVIHGTHDVLVPVAHACWLHEVLALHGRTIVERWMDPQGQLRAPSTSFCHGDPARRPAAAVSTRTEFVFAEGQGHAYTARALAAAQDVAVKFLSQELQF